MAASSPVARTLPLAGRRDVGEALAALSDRLDRLMHEVSLGARSQAEWTRQADEADAIGHQLRATFRGERPGRVPVPQCERKAAA